MGISIVTDVCLTGEEKREFFIAMLEQLGPDREALDKAIEAYLEGHDEARARALSYVAEPRSQELIRRLNQVPGARRQFPQPFSPGFSQLRPA